MMTPAIRATNNSDSRGGGEGEVHSELERQTQKAANTDGELQRVQH